MKRLEIWMLGLILLISIHFVIVAYQFTLIHKKIDTTTPDYQGYESAYDKGFNDCLINQ